MNLAALIYFIDVICGPHAGLVLITLAGSAVWATGFIVNITWGTTTKGRWDYDEAQRYVQAYKSLWLPKAIIVVCMILLTIIPSKETAYKMLAAYGVETLVSNPEVQKLGGKSLDVINKAMDEYLKEEPKK